MADFALDGDAHATGERETARHAVDLAEAALDTFVGAFHLFDGFLGSGERRVHEIVTAVGNRIEVVVENGQRFETLDETVRVIVKDDTTVQQAVWVEDVLQFLHHLVSLVAPFVLHERCHIATRTVLGLQRAVVFLDDEFGHITHHFSIAGYLVFVGKALIEDEVVVTLEGVTIDAGIVIAVIGNKFLQFDRCLGEGLNGEGDILDEA